MSLLILVVLCAAVAVVIRRPLRRHPWPFYGLAVVLAGAYLYTAFGHVSYVVAAPFFAAMQKCTLPFALFTVVMFIGVLPEGSAIRRDLMQVRSQLSIIACILTLGHIAVYGITYAQRLGLFATMSKPLVWSILVAVVLVILLAVLGVTSAAAVKRSMEAWRWKAVQRLAYPFYGLIVLHAVLALAPSAMGGSPQALASLAAYGVLLALYLVLRLRVALREKGVQGKVGESRTVAWDEIAPAESS